MRGRFFALALAIAVPVSGYADPPWNDDCDAVTPFLLEEGIPVVRTGDNTGATVDCVELIGPEVWYAFTLESQMDVSIRHCGTAPAFNNSYVVMDTQCPCSGSWRHAYYYEDSSCGDGNVSLYWRNLPAGTYYWPLLTEPGSEGPYMVTFGANVTCPGDLDGDNQRDLSDLAQLLANYGTTSGATYGDGDMDQDGDVDLTDLAALLAFYGQPCS